MIDVQKLAKQAVVLEGDIYLDERLPAHMTQAFHMHYSISAHMHREVILLDLKEQALLPIVCQRCAEECQVHFEAQSQLAVCQNEALASQYQNDYDVILAHDYKIDLKQILIDNLYLNSATKHETLEKCTANVLK